MNKSFRRTAHSAVAKHAQHHAPPPARQEELGEHLPPGQHATRLATVARRRGGR